MAISEQALNVVLRSVSSEDFGDKKRSWERQKPPVVDWCLNPASLDENERESLEHVWSNTKKDRNQRFDSGIILWLTVG